MTCLERQKFLELEEEEARTERVLRARIRAVLEYNRQLKFEDIGEQQEINDLSKEVLGNDLS